MATSREALQRLDAPYVNFLGDEDYLFQPNTGSWTGSNASLTVESTRLFKGVYHALSVQALSAGSPNTEFSVTHDSFVVGPEFIRDSINSTVNVFCTSPIEVAIRIQNSSPASITSNYYEVPASTWTVIRSDSLVVPTSVTNQTFRATILFRSQFGAVNVLIAHPVVKNAFGFADNLFLRETISRMPRFLIDADSEQQNPQYPMTRFMDVGLVFAGRAFSQALDFRYRDISEGYIENDDATKSTLVDIDAVDPDYMPWLAQFVGIKLERLTAGTTPWGNLPTTWEGIHEDIDPEPDITYTISSVTRDGSGNVSAVVSASPTEFSIGDTVTVEGASTFNGQFELTNVDTGTNTLEWSQSGVSASGSVGTVTLVDSDWIEIESFDITDSNFIPTRRQLVTDRRTGHDAGTCRSLRDGIRYLLSGTQTIDVFFDPIQFPWQIFVKTLTSETPSGITGTQSPLLITELRKVKPMGFIVTHECVDSL
jgi:hypothetical protein